MLNFCERPAENNEQGQYIQNKGLWGMAVFAADPVTDFCSSGDENTALFASQK